MGRSAKRKQFKRELQRERQFRTILAEKSAENIDEGECLQNEETDFQLSERLSYSNRDFKEVLEVLTPSSPASALLLEKLSSAFFSAIQEKNFETALDYLNRIKLDNEYEVGLAKIRGDVLLKSGKIKEAIFYYNKEIEKNNPKAKLIGLFSRAWATLKSGNVSQVVEDISEGTKLWFENAELLDSISFPEEKIIGFKYDLFSIENPMECIAKTCKDLLEQMEGKQALDQELKGRLIYLLYKFGENDSTLLLQSADLIDHPQLSQDLLNYFLTVDNLALAVHHHLTYALWKCSAQIESKKNSFAEFEFKFSYEDKLVSTKTKCTKIHRAAMKHLKVVKEAKLIHSVFIPFYKSF